MSTERIIIKLVDTLPCGMFADTASGFCGRPAWVAYAWQMEAPADMPMWAHLGGCWTVQPVCRQATWTNPQVNRETVRFCPSVPY